VNKNIFLEGAAHIKNKPIINVKNGGVLKIGENVTLNSKNTAYHVSMYSPVKIFSRTKGSKISIGRNTRIHGSCIHAQKSIEIGENCLVAANCQIFDSSGHDMNSKNMLAISIQSKPIFIGNNVWIGANSLIMPGSIIKDGCVVSAGSVVRGEYGKNTLIAGNPSIAIKLLSKK
jgi:acetyltransferase-like isoleucine patch superfamily enzyme